LFLPSDSPAASKLRTNAFCGLRQKSKLVNSNVRHFRSLASVSCIETIVQVKLNKQAHNGSVVRTDYKLVQLHFNSSIYNGEIVKLQFALNDDYDNFSAKIKHVPHLKANNWKIFSQNLCSFLLSLRSSFINPFSFATKRCNTSQGFGAFFVQSCDRSLLSVSFFLFLDFIVILTK